MAVSSHEIPLLVYDLQAHTNLDIKTGQNKDKDSTVQPTEYQSKRNPTVKSHGPDQRQPVRPQPSHLFILCKNRHRV